MIMDSRQVADTNGMGEKHGNLDIVLETDGTLRDASATPTSPEQAGDRPWIGIHFQCCGVYTRVYRQQNETSYEGRCPKCAAKVSLRVGPDGVASRVFTARPV